MNVSSNGSQQIDLRSKVVIVTGAASGIGEATVRALHAAGALPVLAARRADRIEAIGAELGGALAVPTDVTDDRQVTHLVAKTLERHGRIDALVNNAGRGLHSTVENVSLDEFRQVLELNVVSVVRTMQAVIPAMREAGFGRIINVGSSTTVMPIFPGGGLYPGAKLAANQLSAAARLELQDDNITVSVVSPNMTASEFQTAMGSDLQLRPGDVLQGLTAHSTGYVASVILRVLRTGEARIDIPDGPEQPHLATAP